MVCVPIPSLPKDAAMTRATRFTEDTRKIRRLLGAIQDNGACMLLTGATASGKPLELARHGAALAQAQCDDDAIRRDRSVVTGGDKLARALYAGLHKISLDDVDDHAADAHRHHQSNLRWRYLSAGEDYPLWIDKANHDCMELGNMFVELAGEMIAAHASNVIASLPPEKKVTAYDGYEDCIRQRFARRDALAL